MNRGTDIPGKWAIQIHIRPFMIISIPSSWEPPGPSFRSGCQIRSFFFRRESCSLLFLLSILLFVPASILPPSLPHTDFAPFPVLGLPCYPSPRCYSTPDQRAAQAFFLLLSLCLIVNYCLLASLVFSISHKKEDAPLVDNRVSVFLSLVDLWLLHSAVAADTAFYCPSNPRAFPRYDLSCFFSPFLF